MKGGAPAVVGAALLPWAAPGPRGAAAQKPRARYNRVIVAGVGEPDVVAACRAGVGEGAALSLENAMGKKKPQPVPTLCTFCGKPASPVTFDDPFPRTLWAGPSKDRPPKVPSCAPCNNRSNEGILKHFFVALDSRFHAETLDHFKNPKGKGDFRTFSKMWAEIGGKFYLFLDEQVTAKFVKMFMGIRRHLLRRSWFYAPAEQFLLVKIDRREGVSEGRRLPLTVGGGNPAQPVPAEFAEAMDGAMQYKFRDFAYELFANDDDGIVMALRYEREEYAGLGNRLLLLCFVPNPPSAAATDSVDV